MNTCANGLPYTARPARAHRSLDALSRAHVPVLVKQRHARPRHAATLHTRPRHAATLHTRPREPATHTRARPREPAIRALVGQRRGVYARMRMHVYMHMPVPSVPSPALFLLTHHLPTATWSLLAPYLSSPPSRRPTVPQIIYARGGGAPRKRSIHGRPSATIISSNFATCSPFYSYLPE